MRVRVRRSGARVNNGGEFGNLLLSKDHFFAMRKPKKPKSYIQTQQPYLALSLGLTNNLEK